VRATERARQTMTDHVRALVLAGALEGDPVLIGHVLWAALHGAVVLKLAGKLGPECDFDRIVSGAFAALWEGFRPRKG
jgi:hypothetical protein